jgi:Mn2+/Fe2+ NRAMP family transporter
MVAIQIVSAEIGRVSGFGLAGNMRRCYPAIMLYAVVGLPLIANTINIGDDIAAMADALALLVGGPRHAYILGIGAFCILLQVFVSYVRYVRVLATLSLFSYVGVVWRSKSWLDVLQQTLMPSLSLAST